MRQGFHGKPPCFFDFIADTAVPVHRLRIESAHCGCRKRPGLRRDIADILQVHLDFFIDFANDSIFKALAWFNEAGQGREVLGAPFGVPPQQAGIPVGYQYDDGRIDSRKGFSLAFLVAAYHTVSG